MISHIKLVNIVVKNQQDAIAFYTEKLGFKVIVDEPLGNDDARWIELKPPQGQTRIILLKSDQQYVPAGGLSNIVFTTDNVEQTYFKLKTNGVLFKEPPNKQPWGLSAQFEDLDGNIFVLASN
ncbi:MAG: VOC family protein [Gammaproteobacteria bacterium]|nr:VOC family protein [Gammaproteobacteria bacterium]